jgi:predicted transposase YbfD/YdcC
VPISRWSVPEIRREVIARGLVASIGESTLWRWLTEDAIRPWAHRTWIFPRDPAFERKAGRVLDLYQGEWEGKPLSDADCVLSTDEKSSIQARRRIHATLPPAPARAMRVEHEYERRGAWAYLAAWDVRRANLQATAAHFVTQEKAHGRLETRRIWSSTVLNDYLSFPHAAQVACVQREVLHIRKNKTTLETVYLISSLTCAQASPEQLLELNRGHSGIEALHHVRDRAFDEDRCRARKGHAPRALACLRNFAISVLRLLNVRNISAALRALAADASLVLRVLAL